MYAPPMAANPPAAKPAAQSAQRRLSLLRRFAQYIRRFETYFPKTW
jgi:hypothetical protein